MNYLVLKDSLSVSLDSVEHPGRIKSAVTWNESCVCRGKPPPTHSYKPSILNIFIVYLIFHFVLNFQNIACNDIKGFVVIDELILGVLSTYVILNILLQHN